jgi:hypothetical protein
MKIQRIKIERMKIEKIEVERQSEQNNRNRMGK